MKKIKFIISIGFILLLGRMALFANPTFTFESGVNLASATVYQVTPISTGYRMFFSSIGYHIQSATSTDGITWGIENGVRLSTSSYSFEYSSITAFGMFNNSGISGGPYQAWYVGLSSSGQYSILTATSSDQLAWSKDETFTPIEFNSGLGYITSPRPYLLSSNDEMLYYVRDSAGGNTPGNRRAYRMISTDDGETFDSEVELAPNTTAYYIAISTLTDNRVRMHLCSPLSGETTASTLISMISSNDGYTFDAESEVSFSTTSASSSIMSFDVARATENYRWRSFMSMIVNPTTAPYVYSAMTLDPEFDNFSPAIVYQSDAAVPFTVQGEIFSLALAPTAILSKGGVPLSGVTVIRNSDINLTVNANTLNEDLGNYNLKIINDDGHSVTINNVLTIDYKPGFVALTDNLFRPLTGGKLTIAATIFTPGKLEAKMYTTDGKFVKELYNGNVPIGTKTFFWNGDTKNGNTVASGLYILWIKAPKLSEIKKVVVIK